MFSVMLVQTTRTGRAVLFTQNTSDCCLALVLMYVLSQRIRDVLKESRREINDLDTLTDFKISDVKMLIGEKLKQPHLKEEV